MTDRIARWHSSAGIIGGSLIVLVGATASLYAAEPTGLALTGLHTFDREVTSLMNKWEIPGGSLAVAYKGRLVLARGYGLSDRASKTPAQPTTLYRLGSLAKPITAVATLQLMEDGRLNLDDPILPILGDMAPPENTFADTRVKSITIRHLLQHRMGVDRERSGDPVFMPGNAAAAARQQASMPATCLTLLRDGLQRHQDFTPGERHAYSNVGYCMLGRIIEKVSGETYDAFVQAHIFAPVGVRGFLLARTLETAPGEATYYDYPGAKLVDAMPGVATEKVSRPYGHYSMESMDSFGGWLGSPVEFLKFFLTIDGQRGTSLLKEATQRQMLARPIGEEKSAAYYALGFRVRPVKDGTNWWHGGSQPGATAFAVRTAQSYAWVVAFNMRPRDQNKFLSELDATLWRAANAVKNWPVGDLFAQFP